MFGVPDSEEKLTELAEQGLKRAVFVLSQGPRDDVMADLERFAPFIDAMRDA
jgi:hypothetical protein